MKIVSFLRWSIDVLFYSGMAAIGCWGVRYGLIDHDSFIILWLSIPLIWIGVAKLVDLDKDA